MKKLIIPGLLLFFSCSVDHGLGTLDSRITGKVVFLNRDKMPSYVESVRIVAIVHLPPQSLGDVVITNTSVNLSKETPTYYIPAPLAEYELIAAIWKEKGKTWNYSNILSFYGFDPINYTVEYKKVGLTKAQPVAENIDIYCDWSLLTPGW